MSSSNHMSKPFASQTADDHRAPIWVATLLCLTFVVLGVTTRVYVRFKAFGVDDWVIIGAFGVALVQFITVMVGLVNGLGETSDKLSSDKVALAGQVCTTLTIECL